MSLILVCASKLHASESVFKTMDTIMQDKLYSQWKIASACTDWCIFWSNSARVAICNLWDNHSEPVAMHEPYKSNDISCKNTFGVKNGTIT